MVNGKVWRAEAHDFVVKLSKKELNREQLEEELFCFLSEKFQEMEFERKRKDRERRARRYIRKRSRGQCVDCSEKSWLGTARCKRHLNAEREKTRVRQGYKGLKTRPCTEEKTEGFGEKECDFCEDPALAGRSVCEDHSAWEV